MKALLTAVLACASVGAWAQQPPPAPLPDARDPFERMNRATFGFNDAVDRALLKPVAEGYKAAVPELVRTGVSNFFGNIGDVWSSVNNLLQGKPQAAATMAMRVSTNTLFGIGGLFDVASDLGIERQSEDFGQTLGRWGLPSGPYLVLPLLGPSSMRDAAGLPLDTAAGVSAISSDSNAVAALSALQLINARANLLGATRVVEDIALDKYSFVRDGYLSRRRNLVYDGDPPPLPEDKDDAPAPK